MRVVIDSSAWIAGIGSRKGFASQVIYYCYKSDKIEIFISSNILNEVQNNLIKKLKFQEKLAQKSGQIIRNLCDFEISISPKEEKGNN